MYIILILMVLIVTATVTAGIVLKVKGKDAQFKGKKILKLNLLSYVPLLIAAGILMIPQVSQAAEVANEAGNTSANGLGYLAAALSTGLATIGTGVAVGSVGSSALG